MIEPIERHQVADCISDAVLMCSPDYNHMLNNISRKLIMGSFFNLLIYTRKILQQRQKENIK